MNARRVEPLSERHLVRVGRLGVIAWGLVLGSFACVCIYWKNSDDQSLIDFALSVMSLAYAGLVGVFFCALFTRRGSSASVIAALIIGFLWMLLSQPFVYNNFAFLERLGVEPYYQIHFTWKLTIGVLLAFSVCSFGSRQPKASRAAPIAA